MNAFQHASENNRYAEQLRIAKAVAGSLTNSQLALLISLINDCSPETAYSNLARLGGDEGRRPGVIMQAAVGIVPGSSESLPFILAGLIYMAGENKEQIQALNKIVVTANDKLRKQGSKVLIPEATDSSWFSSVVRTLADNGFLRELIQVLPDLFSSGGSLPQIVYKAGANYMKRRANQVLKEADQRQEDAILPMDTSGRIDVKSLPSYNDSDAGMPDAGEGGQL